MLDPVPLAGAGRQMADGDAQTEFIGQRLQFALPQAYPSAVTAAAIGGDQQATGLRIAGATHAVPPAADRIDGETGSIVVDADTHPPRVSRDVIDAIRHGATQFGDQKVVHPHASGCRFGRSSRPPFLKSPTSSFFFVS